MSAAPQPFAFAEDFTFALAAPDPLEASLSERETIGYARGFNEGQASASAQAAQKLATSVERLEMVVADMADLIETRIRAMEQDAARLALSFARLLTADLFHPADHIEAAVRAAMGDLTEGVRLQLHVAPDVAESITPRIEALLESAKATIALSVLPDAALHAGDCRVEWHGGRVIRDQATLEQRLAVALAKAFPQQSPENEVAP